jgi:putative transport protein
VTPLTVLLGIIVTGLLLGRLSLLGISFGTSAILFVALLAGHLGLEIPEGIGQLGLAIFVFCVGISAGPTFFRGLASRGRTMASLGGIIVLSAVLVTWLCAKLMQIPAELAGGLMAGAMTSTPALGAITETSADSSSVAVGFGVAYPIGIVAVVLFVQLALKFLQAPLDTTDVYLTAGTDEGAQIQRRIVEIANPGIVGKRLNELVILSESNCQISRVKLDERWRPTPPDYVFQLGEQVLLVGQLDEMTPVAETLGLFREGDVAILDADRERKIVVVTSKEIFGKSLKELRLRSRHGVTVARIRRHEIEFVPSSRTRIEFGDTLTLVGEPLNLATIERTFGHRPRTLNETDLLSLAIGLGVGILVGNLALDIGGFSISLGIAGGPLAVGLVLGHFRRVGPIRGSFPPAAQLLLTEGGLALFLADAGVGAGENVAQVLREHGPVLLMVAAAIAILPMVVGYYVARRGFRLPLLQVLGATCGGMTSTPGLAVLTGATESSQPVTSYVAAYPVALVLITVLAPLLVKLLSWSL